MILYKPAGARVEEVNFNLGAGASRNGKTIDSLDWDGAELPDFSDTRAYGFPFLDAAIRSVGALNLILQYAINTTPAAAPTLVFTNRLTVAVPAASWGEISGFRLCGRFSRIVVTDTSGAPNNGIYLFYKIRGV